MKSFIFSVFLGFCSFICPATATADETFITRDELFEVALEGDVDGLQRIFAETHRDVSAGRRQISHLRWLNTVLIVSHPDILEVSQDWLKAYPDSIYAKTLVSFQLYDAAWRMRGEGLGRETHPHAHEYFNAYREQAFALAYEAFQTAPGYIPASDALLKLNRTMQVFWSYEIESIVDDVIEQSPNLGTVIRAANMHLPQWGGEGLSGVRRHCRKYIPLVFEREGLTSETCVALLTFDQPFPEPDRKRAAQRLAHENVEEFDATLARVIVYLRIENRHEEVRDLLLANDELYESAVELARDYSFWQGTLESKKLLGVVIERAYNTAMNSLYYDPYSPSLISTIQTYQTLFTPNPLPPDFREKDLDLAAREVGGSPFSWTAWASLAAMVRYHQGFEESRSFQSNAMAYGLHREVVAFNYLSQIHTNWRNKQRAVELELLSPEEFSTIEENMICEVVRLARIADEMCAHNPSFHAESCKPFQSSDYRLEYQVDAVAELMSRAETGPYQCRSERVADLEELMYQPVEADIKQFILDRRPEATD